MLTDVSMSFDELSLDTNRKVIKSNILLCSLLRKIKKIMENSEISCSWNKWSSNPETAQNNFIPISVVYTPLAKNPTVLECATLECYKCRAVFNNFCALDSVSKIFKCSFCGFHNPLPSNYQNNTILEKETIEYFSTQKQSFLHILFVIDITSESLNDLKSSLLLLMNILPNNVFIGIITFSSHVYVYDLQSDHLKCISLRGNKEYDSKLILNLLNPVSVIMLQ